MGTPAKLQGPDYLRSGLKRSLDVVVSGPAAAVSLPIMATLGTVILAQDNHWPFLDAGVENLATGQATHVWKVRTMIPNAKLLEAQVAKGKPLHQFKLTEKDPRVTRAGRIIRATSLDETPQFMNTFLGHLTLVGPRQLSTSEWQTYALPNQYTSPYKELFEMFQQGLKFGVTGLYTVLGRSQNLTMEERIGLEVMYGERASFAADLKLLALTVPTVLKMQGR